MTIVSRPNTKEYRENYDEIFNKSKVESCSEEGTTSDDELSETYESHGVPTRCPAEPDSE